MKLVQFGDNACARIHRYLDSYLNNELLVETNHEVLRHLESCPSCSAEVEARSRLKSRLKSAVLNQSVPAGLEARIQNALRTGNKGAAFEWRRWSAAAAAIAVIALGTWFVAPRGSRPKLPDSADRRGQDTFIQKVSGSLSAVLKVGVGDHIHCSVFRKYPKNPPSPAEMAQKLGPAYENLVPLVKGRIPGDYRIILAHQCGYQGRRFVHLTLTNGSNLLSLVITRKQPGETFEALRASRQAAGVAVYQSTIPGYEVAGFESGQFLAYIVSDSSAKENLQIATTLAPSVFQFLAAVRS